jgi:cell division protein FtsB
MRLRSFERYLFLSQNKGENMAYTVRAYKICPSTTGPMRGKDLCLHIQADTIAKAKRECLRVAKEGNLYYQITDGTTESWFLVNVSVTNKKQLFELQTIPTIFEDTTITRERDIDALTNNVRSLEAQVALLIEQLKNTKNAANNEPEKISHKDIIFGWMNAPAGWEWNDLEREYKQKITGITIGYVEDIRGWQVSIPINKTQSTGFETRNLDYAFKQCNDRGWVERALVDSAENAPKTDNKILFENPVETPVERTKGFYGYGY